MKSKIALIIMIVIIIFFVACSFFLGYNYLKRGDEIQNLNAKIENLSQAQKLDAQKTERDVDSVQEEGNTVGIGGADVRRQMTGNEVIGNYKGQIFEIDNKNYTFDGENM